MKCYYYLDEIVIAINNLIKVFDANTRKSLMDTIVPFVLGIIGTVIGLLLGILITNLQERKKFISNNHIEYLKYLNRLNFNINNILSDIVNIDKFGRILLKSNYQTFSFLPNNSYLDIALQIRTLKGYLTTNQKLYTSTDTQARYYKEIIEASDRIFNTNIFIKTLERNTMKLLVKLQMLHEIICLILI